MAIRYALTTNDNPYNPFDQFAQWFQFDEDNGYHSSSILARFALTSESLSEEANNRAISDAIDEIIKYDYEGKFKKVSQKYEIE